jgi:hypothetical protein
VLTPALTPAMSVTLFDGGEGSQLADFQRISEKRMKGLEPSTFCMANAGSRSRPFAPVR